MTAFKWAGLAFILLAAALAGALTYGNARWNALTRELMARLEAARSAPSPARYDQARELDGLPPPVQRFFRSVLRDDAPMITAATVQHIGTFNMSDSGGGVAQGELMRFVAEASWYPTALLPSQGVRWQAVDETSAKATLSDGPITLTLLFRFGADGTIASIRAEARGRTVQGQVIPTPWEGVWSRYAERDGLRVPLAGEVAWLTPEGRKPYWRGTITALTYEFAAW